MGTEIWRYGILGMKWSVRPTPIKAIGGNTLFQLIPAAFQEGVQGEPPFGHKERFPLYYYGFPLTPTS